MQETLNVNDVCVVQITLQKNLPNCEIRANFGEKYTYR